MKISLTVACLVLLSVSALSADSSSVTKIVWLPMPAPQPLVGMASFYGDEDQGKPMANGKPFNKNKLTAATYDLPLGSRVRVTNLKNGKSIVVVITDRGPNHRLHRLIDLSEEAAARLGYTHQGLTLVSVNSTKGEKR